MDCKWYSKFIEIVLYTVLVTYVPVIVRNNGGGERMEIRRGGGTIPGEGSLLKIDVNYVCPEGRRHDTLLCQLFFILRKLYTLLHPYFFTSNFFSQMRAQSFSTIRLSFLFSLNAYGRKTRAIWDPVSYKLVSYKKD